MTKKIQQKSLSMTALFVPEIRALLWSGFTKGEEFENLIKEGVKVIMQKPFGKVLLSQKVAEAMSDD